MPDAPVPPQPLEMTEDDVKRVSDYLYKTYHDLEEGREHLLVEILDALRRIEHQLTVLNSKR